MSNAPDEMQDLSQIIGGLLINIGTVTDKDGMLLAGKLCRKCVRLSLDLPQVVGLTLIVSQVSNLSK